MRLLIGILAGIIFAAPGALAANSVVVESKTVNANAMDVPIGVSVENDAPIRGYVVPLEFRTTGGTAFITSLRRSFPPGTRLDGHLTGVRISNQYEQPDPTACDRGAVYGYKLILTQVQDSMIPVTASPEGVMFTRLNIQDSNLPAGSDGNNPQILMTVKIGGGGGTFEIDTTCTAPKNHLVYAADNGQPILPSFTKGVITVNGPGNLGCKCAQNGDVTDDRHYDVMDVVGLIDYVFSSGIQPPTDLLCPLVDRGDVNCDGLDDVLDIVHLIDFVFNNGAEPCGWCPCAPEWVRIYDGTQVTNRGEAIVVDRSGSIYVAGTTYNWTTRPPNPTMIKYSPSGDSIWVREPLILGDVIYAHNGLDSSGNLYVVASEEHGGGGGYRILKYDPSGYLLWGTAKYFGSGHSWAQALAIDLQGNLFVSGYARFSDADPYDYGTVKYDSAGVFQWERHFGPGNVSAIAVDAAGNSFATGTAGTVAHSPSGDKLWRNSDPGGCIAVDMTSGNVCVGGSSTRLYDPNGNLIWSDSRSANSIRVHQSGNIYATGLTTRKYSAFGQLLWEAPTGGTDIAISLSGTVCVLGYSTVAFDTDGNRLWESDVTGAGVALDQQGNAYVIGSTDQDMITTKIPYYGPCGPAPAGHPGTLGVPDE